MQRLTVLLIVFFIKEDGTAIDILVNDKENKE